MKCPKCGKENTLIVSELSQNSRDYKVLSNGKISKKYTIQRDIWMDVNILTCTNGCNLEDVSWGIDEDDNLVIYNE